MTSPSKNREAGRWRALGGAMSIPWILLASVLVGVFLGKGLDGWLDTSPVFLLIGLLLGLLSGVRETVILLRKIERRG